MIKLNFTSVRLGESVGMPCLASEESIRKMTGENQGSGAPQAPSKAPSEWQVDLWGDKHSTLFGLEEALAIVGVNDSTGLISMEPLEMLNDADLIKGVDNS